MAFTRKSSVAIVRNPAPPAHSRKITKLETRLKAVAKRGSVVAERNESLLCSVGAVGALAMLEKRGTKLPSVMGLDPALVAGAAFYLLGAKVASGKTARRIEAAGEGLLAYAAGRSIERGSVKVSVAGEESDGLDEAA